MSKIDWTSMGAKAEGSSSDEYTWKANKEGDSITGVLTSVKEVTTRYGQKVVVNLAETAHGDATVWPTQGLLNALGDAFFDCLVYEKVLAEDGFADTEGLLGLGPRPIRVAVGVEVVEPGHCGGGFLPCQVFAADVLLEFDKFKFYLVELVGVLRGDGVELEKAVGEKAAFPGDEGMLPRNDDGVDEPVAADRLGKFLNALDLLPLAVLENFNGVDRDEGEGS